MVTWRVLPENNSRTHPQPDDQTPYTLNTRYKTCDNCAVLWYKRIHVAIVKKLSKESRKTRSFLGKEISSGRNPAISIRGVIYYRQEMKWYRGSPGILT